MEALIAIVVIIGLMEFREYRQLKKLEDILKTQNELLEDMVALDSNDIAMQEIVSKLGLEVSKATTAATETLEVARQTRELVEKAEANSATVLREYELNGIPLGLQRKQPDYIEGL